MFGQFVLPAIGSHNLMYIKETLKYTCIFTNIFTYINTGTVPSRSSTLPCGQVVNARQNRVKVLKAPVGGFEVVKIRCK